VATKMEQLIQRHTALKNERSRYEDIVDDITTYIAPRLYRPDVGNYTRGQRNMEAIYDPTGIHMHEGMTDAFQGHMVSDTFRWFTLILRDRGLMDNPEVRMWLQSAEDHLYGVFGSSNFYEAINELLAEGVGVGTAHLWVEDVVGEGKLQFTPIPFIEMAVGEDRYGRVDKHYREFYLKVDQAVERFGVWSNEIEQMLKNSPTSRVKILHVVRPRDSWIRGSMKPNEKKFENLFIDLDRQKEIRSGGMDMNHYATWRYRKVTGETYGRSPSWAALRDVKMLNELSKAMITIVQKQANPPLWAPERLNGKINRLPGGLNFYTDPSERIDVVGEVGNVSLVIEWMDRLRQRIRETYRLDTFLALSMQDKQLTATEVRERRSEKNAMLTGIVGRFAAEMLDPIIDIAFDIETKAGRMPPIPDVLMEESDGRVEIDYIGPLAQAQKALKVQGSINAIDSLAQYAQIAPNILDIVKWVDFAQEVAEANGMRVELVRTDEELQAIEDQKKEAEAQAMQQQQMAEFMKSPNAAKSPDQDSVMQQLMTGRMV
jgi:hypothetical protein